MTLPPGNVILNIPLPVITVLSFVGRGVMIPKPKSVIQLKENVFQIVEEQTELPVNQQLLYYVERLVIPRRFTHVSQKQMGAFVHKTTVLETTISCVRQMLFCVGQRASAINPQTKFVFCQMDKIVRRVERVCRERQCVTMVGRCAMKNVSPSQTKVTSVIFRPLSSVEPVAVIPVPMMAHMSALLDIVNAEPDVTIQQNKTVFFLMVQNVLMERIAPQDRVLVIRRSPTITSADKSVILEVLVLVGLPADKSAQVPLVFQQVTLVIPKLKGLVDRTTATSQPVILVGDPTEALVLRRLWLVAMV